MDALNQPSPPKIPLSRRIPDWLAICILLLILGGFAYWVLSTAKFCCVLPRDLTPDPHDEQAFASWKTYRNEEYGYEVKYPLDWSAEEQPDSTYFYKEKVEFDPGVKIFPVGHVVNVDEYLGPLLQQGKKENISVNGMQAVRFYDFPAVATAQQIFLNRGNITFILNVSGDSGEQEVFDSMLSTFRFVQ